MERILVPVDGSDASARAAAWASAYAARTAATLLLLHVHQPAGGETLAMSSLSAAEIDESTRRIAAPAFAMACAEIADDVGVDTLVSLGDPADEIVALARREGASLIVMGSRGLSPVRELLLGSVSEKVLRHAHCAVTIVR